MIDALDMLVPGQATFFGNHSTLIMIGKNVAPGVTGAARICALDVVKFVRGPYLSHWEIRARTRFVEPAMRRHWAGGRPPLDGHAGPRFGYTLEMELRGFS